jgi:outer membrane lipoprotein-sorting protein
MAVMPLDARRPAVACLLLCASLTVAEAAKTIPLPPRRPPDLIQRQPTVAAPVTPATKAPEITQDTSQSASPLEDMSREQLIAEVNSALTKLKQFNAKFSQTDQNGQSVSGQLTVLRPGRLRFDYNPPSALKIIADGNNVAVIDERLGTRDLYSIGLTPLKFLLSRSIDLGREFKISDIRVEQDRLILEAEDSATFGGSSQIDLIFDRKTLLLRSWTVIDPQGYAVTIKLTQIDTKHEPDPMGFVIPETVTPTK